MTPHAPDGVRSLGQGSCTDPTVARSAGGATSCERMKVAGEMPGQLLPVALPAPPPVVRAGVDQLSAHAFRIWKSQTEPGTDGLPTSAE